MSRSGRVIGLISGKGGVGKTSLCVNLGASLDEFGSEVTVVDADIAASNLGVHLGRYDHPVKIQDILEDDMEVTSAEFRHPSGLKAISSAKNVDRVEPELDQMREVLEDAASRSDYVLVDCPPGINSDVEQVMDSCDELLIITEPTQTSGLNAAQIIEKAKELNKPILGTVVNKVDDDPDMELIEREIEMMTESHILSKIPFDKTMKKSLFEREPLLHHAPMSEASLEIKELAAEMHGVEYERPKFAKFKRKMRRLSQTLSK
jgi:septum site-determining protein MinD